MARRRGFLRRLVDRILGRPSAPRPLPRREPVTPRTPSRRPTPVLVPDIRTSQQRAVDNIIANLPLAHRGRVTRNVEFMDDDELEWTATATADQIRFRAKQDADRLRQTDDGDFVPLNPWWYG